MSASHVASISRVLVVATAAATVVIPVARREVGADTALASNGSVKAGLVTLCSTDTFVRVGGLNESSRDVTIGLTERSENGKTVTYLGSNASDQLRAIFPITIPANSKYRVTWDLPLPATDNGKARPGNSGAMHGSWGGGPWLDENGLSYVGTGGSAGRNGQTCSPPPAAPATTIAAPTTTTNPPVMTSTSSTTSTSTTSTSTTSTTLAPAPAALLAVRPVSVYSTINSQLAGRAVDGNNATAFTTQMAEWAYPTWAWWTADFGEPVPLRRIVWRLAAANTSDTMRIEVSNDGRSWTRIATPDDDTAGSDQQLDLERTTRLVRFTFRSTSPRAQLGQLSEVSFFAASTFVSAGPTGPSPGVVRGQFVFTVKPSTPVKMHRDRYKIASSARSSNSPPNSSYWAMDAKADTAWRTAMTSPPTAGWVAFDLGSPAPMGEIRWKFSQVGYADRYRVEVSDDGSNWTTIATRTNAPAVGEQMRQPINRTARFVRLFFDNPNRDPDVGFVTGVRIFPPAP
jgi:hypothetical protein